MKAWKLHIVIYLVLPIRAYTQIPSAGGTFTANYIKGCVGMTVEVTSNAPSGGTAEFNFDYGNNPADFDKPTTHIYDQPGTYWIGHHYQGESGDYVKDSLLVEVQPYVAPEFMIARCEDYHAAVVITDDEFDWYRINFTAVDFVDVPKGAPAQVFDFQSGNNAAVSVRGYYDNSYLLSCPASTWNFQPVDDIVVPQITRVSVLNQNEASGEIEIMTTAQDDFYELEYSVNSGEFMQYDYANSSLLTLGGLDTENNFYCFRLKSFAGCPGSQPEYSQTICSINLQAEALNNENHLELRTNAAFFNGAQVIRDGIPVGPTPSMTFIDFDVECAQQYCYRVEANSSSYSAEQCITGQSSDIPPAVDHVVASFSADGADISWIAPSGISIDHFSVYRSDNGSGYVFQEVVTGNQFHDVGVDGRIPVCYLIEYEDACGNLSAEGIPACPVFLQSVVQQGRPELLWTDYSGFIPGVKYYVVEKTDSEGNMIGYADVGLANAYIEPADNEEQAIFYRILAINGQDTSYSNRIKVVYETLVYFPNAFTPDGDHLNNTFKPVVRYFKEYELVIYNRWGAPIFFSNDPSKGWDGRYNETDAPQGAYVYTAVITDSEGTRFEKKGVVHLLRKR